MTGRFRLIYEKRNGACFVPHVALATVFARAAARAGIKLRMTEGFSPRGRMSFGPELPAGVVALREPLDVWLDGDSLNGEPDDIRERWNARMPEGFFVRRCTAVPDGSPSLGKVCQAARYLVWAREAPSAEVLLEGLESHYGEDILNSLIETEEKNARVSFVLAAPAGNGIGRWVKTLAASNVICGWQDLCIVRADIGRWNDGHLESLAEEDDACLRNARLQTEFQTEK